MEQSKSGVARLIRSVLGQNMEGAEVPSAKFAYASFRILDEDEFMPDSSGN